MSEWSTKTISEIADIFDGPHATPSKTETGPWFLSISSLDNGRLNLAESAHLSEEDFERWTRRVTPSAGDILFSYETRLGDAALMPSGIRACLGRRMGLLRPRSDQVNSRFLLYAYLSPGFQEVIRQRSIHGATVDRIPLTELSGWPIAVPPLREQEAIAAVLGALDDKIAVNDRIVSTVDRLGRTIFHTHFAEALDYITQAAELPPAWDVLTLGEGVSIFETGSRPRGGVSGFSTGVPSIGAESIIQLANFDFAKVKYVPEEHFTSMKRGVVQSHDILIYKDGGRPGNFEPHVSMFGNAFPFARMCINEHVYRVRMSSPLTQAFGYFWLSSDPLLNEMRKRGTGVAIPGLNSTAARELPLVRPPADRLERFDILASPLIDKALSAAAEARTLSQLRDTLLPKLMSGEIRVRDAERRVEETV